jgi:hypothetical protein
MKFIKRIPITAGMISNEQAQQTDLWYTNESGALVAVAPWVSGQNVATGDRRSHDQKVWQALNTHASTAEPDLSPTLWAFVAPTNRWAAFDDAVGSTMQETGSISFTLAPGERFDSFGCLGMVGSELTAEVIDPIIGTFYTTTIPLIDDEDPVIDFWTYCFAGFKQKENILVTDLNSASYTTARIKITISGATTSDPVKLGTFNFGMVQVLGITEMGMKTGITNYSSYNVDQFGVTRIIPQTFAKKINANVMVDRASYNTVFQSLVDYKDTAVIVFPSDSEDYSKATTYGHIREWSLSIDYPTYTMLPIEVRGLT